MSDAAARERIATSLDESLLVEAAAGTGKTTELVRRIVATLASGRTTVDRMVAVTFTNKAAGELKLRLRQEIDRARRREDDPGRREALSDALARLEEAHVGTIHSFCAEILRRRPVEARIDPGFREIDGETQPRIFDRAFRSWIERRLGAMPPALHRVLVRLADQRSADGASPLTRLRRAAAELAEWRDHTAPWQRPEDFDRDTEVDTLVEEVRAVAEMARACPNRSDHLYKDLRPVIDFAIWIRRSESWAPRDHDLVESRLESLSRELRRKKGKGRGREYAPGVLRETMIERRDALVAALGEALERWNAELAVGLRDELLGAVEEYEALKLRLGVLDFLDLVLRTRDLLRDDADVRRDLQERFTHFFVDEVQDTDPLQLEILLLLAADDPDEGDWRATRPRPGKLFLVGDPKQSIYRFRRADVLLYRALQEQLRSAGVGILHLSRSFRSVAAIQDCVNAAFELRMTDDPASGQSAYVALEPFRDSPEDRPSVVVLPAPNPFGWNDRYWFGGVEESLPPAIAGFVDWLVHESGWTVDDPHRPGTSVPILPRHVAVLFRRFVSWQQDVTAGVQKGLEERGVPHVLVGGRSYHEREEVLTMRTALRAIEWPDDELSVFATLRDSLFAIGDTLLLRFRETVGPLHPTRALPEDLPTDYLPIVDALRTLGDLHRHRNRVPVAGTIQKLLEETRAAAGFALRPAGHQVLANVQQLCDRARRFETSGGLSFRAFVEQLDGEAEERSSSGSTVLDDNEEGVRILTVHSAKGLEFPVVILADPTCREAPTQASRIHDATQGLAAQRLLGWAPRELLEGSDVEIERERAEAVRLAYVAATRARDLLVVPGLGHGPMDRPGWLTSLDPAIYPLEGSEQQSTWSPGCPRFGPSTTAQSPATRGPSIRPGLHRAQAGRHGVVWWDPSLLEPRVPPKPGIREERILGEDPDGSATEAGLDAWDEWTERHEDALAAGSRPTFVVRAPSESEGLPEPPPAEIRLEAVEPRPARPRGLRFGTLVHTLLRDARPDLGADDLEELARLHGRLTGAMPAEVSAAVPCVRGALAHPVVTEAFAGGEARRELPFLLRLDGGVLIEGSVDLAFREADGSWTVVDFKTDAELDEREDEYRRQVGWYVEALRRATGAEARGVLLRI